MKAISNSDIPVPSRVDLEKITKVSSEEKLRGAAKEFEGMFMDLVLKSMRDTVPEQNVMGDSGDGKIYQSMLDSEYSKLSTSKRGLGLADAIYRQLAPTLKDAEKPKD